MNSKRENAYGLTLFYKANTERALEKAVEIAQASGFTVKSQLDRGIEKMRSPIEGEAEAHAIHLDLLGAWFCSDKLHHAIAMESEVIHSILCEEPTDKEKKTTTEQEFVQKLDELIKSQNGTSEWQMDFVPYWWGRVEIDGKIYNLQFQEDEESVAKRAEKRER